MTMTGGVKHQLDRLPIVSEADEAYTTTADIFETRIKALKGEIWAAREVIMSLSIDGILDSLRDGTEVGVSDGSFKDKFGTDC